MERFFTSCTILFPCQFIWLSYVRPGVFDYLMFVQVYLTILWSSRCIWLSYVRPGVFDYLMFVQVYLTILCSSRCIWLCNVRPGGFLEKIPNLSNPVFLCEVCLRRPYIFFGKKINFSTKFFFNNLPKFSCFPQIIGNQLLKIYIYPCNIYLPQ